MSQVFFNDIRKVVFWWFFLFFLKLNVEKNSTFSRVPPSTSPKRNKELPANSTHGEIPKRNENMSIQKLVHKFHSNIFTTVKKWNNPMFLTDEWISKMWYIYTMKYYLTMEWSTNTCHNMDEPWKHYAKSKKPVTKDHILYNSIYTKYSEQANP